MQLEEKFHPEFQERIDRMKEKIVFEPHKICIDRAKLITDSYRSTKGENPIIRFAKSMEYLLSNMAIKIWENEFIVGNRCTKLVGTPLYPEVRIDTIETDIDIYDTRQAQRFLITDEDRNYIKEELIPYWKNEDETVQERWFSYLNSDLLKRMIDLVYVLDTDITNGIGHFFPGHENVLKCGFDGLIQQINTQLDKIYSDDEEKALFLESALIVLRGAKNFIKRLLILD